jgi:putative nucleotidyltransferase with HDIG domain
VQRTSALDFKGASSYKGMRILFRGQNMKGTNRDKTKEELRRESAALKQQVARLKTLMARHEQSATELRRVTRALKVLSTCNHELMHARDIPTFMREVCRIIVEVGGYRLAWVGFAGRGEAKTVHPVAQYGYGRGYLDTVNITWSDTERGRGPTGTAIRTGKPVIARNILTDRSFGPWRSEAVKRGYASCIALPLSGGRKVLGSLTVYAAEPDAFDKEEAALLTGLANDIAYGISVMETRAKHRKAEDALKQSFGTLRKVLEGTMYALAEMSQQRDPYTAGHQRRVAQLACAIAREMGLPESQREGIRMSALLHDIGKMHVPSEILTRPGQISDLETGMIEAHARAGYEILRTIEFPWPVARTVLQHQERLDGSGYPAGLSDGEILLEARILAVADVVEAMSSHRPYRATLGMNEALKEISRNRGILYDPDVVDACLILLSKKKFKFE